MADGGRKVHSERMGPENGEGSRGIDDAEAAQGNRAKGGEGKMGRQEAAKEALVAAIDEELQQNPPGEAYDPAYSTFGIMQRLAQVDRWPAIREQLVFEAINGMVQRRLDRNIKAEAKVDARQGLLALPGFERVSPWVKIEGIVVPLKKVTLEQHRGAVKDRAKLIKRQAYPRWSDDRMKREKEILAQERKLDRKVAPLTAGDKQMELGPVMELYQASLETPSPAIQQRRKAIKSRWDRKKARMQNQ